KDVFTSHNQELAELISQTAVALELPVKIGVVQESSDAAPFSWEKIPAVSITSLDSEAIIRYDVREDLPPYIREENLQRVYRLCRRTARVIDKYGKER